MFIGTFCAVVMLLIYLFWLLLKQSKKPTGLIGLLMMRLWNGVYLPLVKWTMKHVNLEDVSTILDIGIGNGASSAYLLQQANELSVTGIDISKDAIIQAKKKYSNGSLHFETMNVHSLAFPSESFDLVTAFQTHFHWDHLDQALLEIHRVLKRDGLVIFACEAAKINYFLPEFKVTKNFKTYMSQFGFSLTAQQATSQWIMYTFQKTNRGWDRSV